MTREVSDAIVVAVRAATPWELFDAIVPKTPPLEYGVVFPAIGQLERLTMRWQPDDGRWHWYVTSVGQDRRAAGWHAGQVRDYLMDRGNRVQVDGWACSMVTHVHSENPTRDESATPRPVVIAVNEYSLLATRI